MECDICAQGASAIHKPFHCITCARSYLEAPRIALARVLMDKDGVEKHVQAAIQGLEDKSSQHVSLTDSKGGLLVDRAECTNNVNWQRTQAETAEIQDRLQLISEQTDRLSEHMAAARLQLEARRAANAQRKSDLSSATYGIASRRANELDRVQQSVKRIDYKSDKMHQDTTELRMQLSTTAAKLAGLKSSKRKTKDGGVKDVFSIGPGTRLKIWDLRHLTDAPPDHLSASLAAMAQLLVRVAAYLGIRLPAEVTLPHNDYPQPTIFSLSSSYQGKKVPFPGSTPSHSSSNSPEASRTLDPRVHLPRPRTLFIDRPLTNLSAEDPPAYSSFIEGVSLLAYNIAWLCRTQGMKDGFKVWEDVCPMARNLHRLLIAQETYFPQRLENPLDKDMNITKSSSKLSFRKTPVGFGQLSHATSHSFINKAENTHYLSGWTLTPTKITDELKGFLLAEQQAQEWDVVNQKEWEDMQDMVVEDPPSTKDDASEGERKRGTSGWTKVKSRNEEVAKQTILE